MSITFTIVTQVRELTWASRKASACSYHFVGPLVPWVHRRTPVLRHQRTPKDSKDQQNVLTTVGYCRYLFISLTINNHHYPSLTTIKWHSPSTAVNQPTMVNHYPLMMVHVSSNYNSRAHSDTQVVLWMWLVASLVPCTIVVVDVVNQNQPAMEPFQAIIEQHQR